MYNPYLALAEKYFPNAICAVDSYHVIQWILHRLNLLLISFQRNMLKETDGTSKGDRLNIYL